MSQLVMLKKLKLNGSNEDLQDLLELTPPKDTLFIIGDWNANVGSQEIPGVTGKFDPGVQNEAGQRPTEFCQENTLVIANYIFYFFVKFRSVILSPSQVCCREQMSNY